jgi:hypothetical protein
MNENIPTVEEALRLRLATSASQKALAKVARDEEAAFLATQKELHPSLYPEEDRKAYSDLIKDAQSPAVLEKALNLAGKAHPSPADDDAAKMRAKVLLRRAFAPYVASVVALLKGALDEVGKAAAEIEKDEARLFQKWNCPSASTYLTTGARQLAARLKEQVDAFSDPNNPHVRPGKLTTWIKYASGDPTP